VLGRDLAPHSHGPGLGYDHIEVVIDDHSRFGVVVSVPDESSASAAQALELAAAQFAQRGIVIERVLTDNGFAYTRGRAYSSTIVGLGIRHKRTRPYRPQTNGKAERFIQTLINEWAYGRPYRSNQERLDSLPVFVDFYNSSRPHTALGGHSPLSVVNNVRGDHT
jgi:transposase InsO family protein